MSSTQKPCKSLHACVLVAVILALTNAAAGDEIRLSALDLGAATQGYGNPAVDRSVDGHPLTIGGQTFAHGFGTHGDSRLVIDLKGSASRFTARVGVDDETYKKPYELMGHMLRAQNRDIVFSLCQYGMDNARSAARTRRVRSAKPR
jgi:hypothetical protein